MTLKQDHSHLEELTTGLYEAFHRTSNSHISYNNKKISILVWLSFEEIPVFSFETVIAVQLKLRAATLGVLSLFD